MTQDKAQISFEFIIIFTLIFVTLIGFTFIINSRLTDVNEREETLILRDLANNIKNEIILASSVNNNYLRRFNIPPRLAGKKYNMTINNDELLISLIEKNKIVREYFSILPRSIKGSFIKNISINTTEHCITKNDFDGIRIARNQASLDTEVTSVSVFEEFDVLVSLNCVDDIKSAQFTFRYDPLVLELLEDKILPVTKITKPDLNPLFKSFLTVLPYDGATLPQEYGSLPYVDRNLGRYTYGFIGRGSATGSGNIAQLTFLVKDIPLTGPGPTSIEFDPTFAGQDIVILDATTNKETKEGLPESRHNIRISIV